MNPTNPDSSSPDLASPRPNKPKTISAQALRGLGLEAGLADAGFVEIDRAALAFEKADILRAYPKTKTLVSVIFALNPENIQSLARHVASAEVHRGGDELSAMSRTIIRGLNRLGIRGVMTNADFPMDMSRYPGKIWDVSHKLVAVEAGLGRMGVNRLLIHPEFGNFLRLGTLLIDAEVDKPGAPLEHSPCIGRGLCVSVCPVGAISASGPFDFMACMTHAHRDNMGGFLDLIDSVLQSRDLPAFRERFRDSETASMWQSLMYKMNYRCGYCMAACPAGRDCSQPYAGQKKAYVREVVLPLKNHQEVVYVAPGSRAEAQAAANPRKEVRRVVNHAMRRS